ncbi:MAG: shikimate kinase [Bacillota bacterium]|nr:shikimate kinase [Bacillota bacterium]
MKYGLIGKTLVHSYSKEIHETLGKYQYELYSLTPEEMPDFVKAHDFGGLNVTIPYKQDVIPLCDHVSELAASIGAVNTLYRKDGRLTGHNTDYEGFLYNAERSGISFDGRTVLILGTGGTSLMARKAVADQGAAEIFIASRSQSEAHMLTYERLPEIADKIQVIINTTPVGTFPGNMQSVISLDDFPACESVIDVIYNPFKTRLLLDAQKKGLRYANGLPMLVAQATAAAGYFLGTPGAFISENERIIAAMERQMQNIVLIGMPGSGKSTIGGIVSELTGKELVDMDEEIVKRANMTIPEIFEKYGEKYFRDMESEVAAELGKQCGLVIATGGGAVLRPENVDALRQNALMVHISRPVSSLPTDGRPLSKDVSTLITMEKERMPLYTAAADVTLDNSKKRHKQQLTEAIREALQL